MLQKLHISFVSFFKTYTTRLLAEQRYTSILISGQDVDDSVSSVNSKGILVIGDQHTVNDMDDSGAVGVDVESDDLQEHKEKHNVSLNNSTKANVNINRMNNIPWLPCHRKEQFCRSFQTRWCRP